MAQQTVNTTDTVEQMRGKVNANFTEVYSLGLPAYYTDTGGDDSYVITTDIAYSALTAGMAFALKPTTGNTGACTLAVDSTGAIAIKVVDASGVRDPLTGEIPAGGIAWLQYNGTYWILLNPSPMKSSKTTLHFVATGSPIANEQTLVFPGTANIGRFNAPTAINTVKIYGQAYSDSDGVLLFGAQSAIVALTSGTALSVKVNIAGGGWRLQLYNEDNSTLLAETEVIEGITEDFTEISGFIEIV